MAKPQLNTLWTAGFLLLAASLSLPFLVVHEPPLLDYPNHLARTFVLAHLHDAAYRFAGYYRADWKPYPYVLWDLIMVAMQRVLPVETAGRLLLMLTTSLLPVSVAWFLWQVNRDSLKLAQVNRDSIKLAFLACALSYNVLFFWGFTAYHLSMSFCFLMLGTWFWYRRKPSPWRAALFVVVSFLAYFAHLLGFASAAFILVLYVLTEFNWREWLRLACFLAPPSLLFLWARPGLSERSTVEWRPFLEKLDSLRLIPTHGYNDTLDAIFIAGLVLCLLVAVVRNPELKVNRRWLAVFVGFFLVYLVLPYGWGSSFDLDVRLIAPLCLLSLAVLRVGRRANWIVVLAVVLVAIRVYGFAAGFRMESEKSAAMNQAIQHVERNATIFPLVDTCKDEDPLDYYYVHYWAYAVIRRGARSPYLFDIPGQTPMRIDATAYMSDGYWGHCYDGEPDWKQVAAGYNYIWSYGDDRYRRGISEVADKVFEQRPLALYRVRR